MIPHAQVIVVGAGHAGCEAALASARCGAETLLLTIQIDAVAAMPCNPSIGGQGKGHLVREIDALGGMMGRIADETQVQARLLNTRKGLAVQAIRVQSDKEAYSRRMRKTLQTHSRLHLAQGTVTEVLVENGRVAGVRTMMGDVFRAPVVILAPGTFLRGVIHIGRASFGAGRAGEPPADELGACLERLGLPMRRFKTGTPPRIDASSIDTSGLERQDDEVETPPFSLWSDGSKPLGRMPCFLTRTTEKTHEVIRAHIHESALVSGRISGTGPRYCPSIEDKVSKFPEKSAHKVFLEPERADGREIYLQGMSTSLPEGVQEKYVRTLPGLEHARLTRPGYAIEYDMADPGELFPTLMSRRVPNLFLAGQLNGTSGYEEAAAQGLLAGANAAAIALGRQPVVLSARDSYLGLMVEEITTQPLGEPYRIFTSRSPWRLQLRMSNAEARLADTAFAAGLISEERRKALLERQRWQDAVGELLAGRTVDEAEAQEIPCGSGGPVRGRTSLEQLLKRPEVRLEALAGFVPELAELDRLSLIELEARVKYAGYAIQQERELELLEKFRELRLPESLLQELPAAVSTEARLKIAAVRPGTLGELSRIPGVRAADVAAVLAALKRGREPATAGDAGRKGG
ncbi:MAG TPA: tRNA uridine-5-carboxymethylaminomethyl(34) synthesis enzyme MnmG [Candidatus Ozemobacteraceae bacterium]|mgnify:CR=1 FL=1|nr:tRNA uridine-5-carboxymethylaminomethyl(34) synthesis enzyme MnmG [Candidatus Ozemobacteraceae bacterium]